MTKAVEPTEDKSLLEKGIEKLVELKDEIMPAHGADNLAHDAAPVETEEHDDRRPLWVRLAFLSVPIVVGALVKRAMNRRAAETAKAVTAKAAKSRTRVSRAKPAARKRAAA